LFLKASNLNVWLLAEVNACLKYRLIHTAITSQACFTDEFRRILCDPMPFMKS